MSKQIANEWINTLIPKGITRSAAKTAAHLFFNKSKKVPVNQAIENVRFWVFQIPRIECIANYAVYSGAEEETCKQLQEFKTRFLLSILDMTVDSPESEKDEKYVNTYKDYKQALDLVNKTFHLRSSSFIDALSKMHISVEI